MSSKAGFKNTNNSKNDLRKGRPSWTATPSFFRPKLQFSPYAYAKLLFLRDFDADCEVGCFGISKRESLLYVEDLVVVEQQVSITSVEFDDDAVADFFETQVEAGRNPEEFARIWVHTHPFDSANPSSIDLETFHRVFGYSHWAVMAILAQDNTNYAELRFNVGPRGSLEIPWQIDYSKPFAAADHEAWGEEYFANVSEKRYRSWYEQGTQVSRSYDPRKTPVAPTPLTPNTLESGTYNQAWVDAWQDYTQDDAETDERWRQWSNVETYDELDLNIE